VPQGTRCAHSLVAGSLVHRAFAASLIHWPPAS
jgi:hypothetical protein